ncbi:MAG: hypothetical protein JW941_11870 [Candidatus Coatesbacteria bacterium]|nr:hypothetical protein [Candidatus Coatesbacteria bacterium]
MRNREFEPPADIQIANYGHPGDLSKILSIMEGAFDRSFSEKHWEWKYHGSLMGHAGSIVMVDGNAIVGHWGFSAVRYKIGSGVYIGYVSFDMAIDRNVFGRRDAAVRLLRLGKMAYHIIEAKGAVFGSGFPNTNSLFLGIKRLGWMPLLHIPNMACYLRLEPFLRRRLKSRVLVKAVSLPWRAVVKVGLYARFLDLWPSWGRKIRKVERFDQRVNVLWENVSRKIGNAVVRDMEYLNWRYCDPLKPVYHKFVAERKDEVVGYIVLRLMEDGDGVKQALIADILAKDHHPLIASQLILTAVRFAVKNHCDVVRAWCLKHSPYMLFLRAVGFLKRKSLVYFVLRPWTPNPKIARQVIKAAAWHVMMGDSDSV